MAQKSPKDGFSQRKIGDKKPAGFSANPRLVTFTLSMEPKNRNINFVLTENVPAGQLASGVILREPGNGEYYLAITRDTILTIMLADNIDWRWHQNGAAITTKDQRENLYAVLGGFDDPMSASVVLYCKSRGGVHPKEDGFSFSVDLLQSSGSYLPITIDPDIKNPPPGNGLTVDLGPAGGDLSVNLSATTM